MRETSEQPQAQGAPRAKNPASAEPISTSGRPAGEPRFIRASELARKAGVGKSAVSNAVKKGRIAPGPDGLFDLRNHDVRDYVEFESGQRRAALERREEAAAEFPPASTPGRSPGPSPAPSKLEDPASFYSRSAYPRLPIEPSSTAAGAGSAEPAETILARLHSAGADTSSPAVLDTADALLGTGERVLRVDRVFVVSLVAELHAIATNFPQNDEELVDAFGFEEALMAVFKRWAKAYLGNSLEEILLEAAPGLEGRR